MRKVLKFLMLFLGMCILSTGCNKEENPNETISYIKQLKSYKAKGKVFVINNAQTKEYKYEQVFQKGSGSYLKVNNERQMWFLDDKIIDDDMKSGKKTIQSRIYENVYEWTFLEKYLEKIYCDEKIKTKYEEEEGNRYLIVELILCSNNRNLDKAEVYIGTEDGKPHKVVVYDEDKNERLKVTYDNFEGNAKIRDDFFDTRRLLNID